MSDPFEPPAQSPPRPLRWVGLLVVGVGLLAGMAGLLAGMAGTGIAFGARPVFVDMAEDLVYVAFWSTCVLSPGLIGSGVAVMLSQRP